jgi:hypothetical protein
MLNYLAVCNDGQIITLLRKIFLGAGKTAFLGAGAISVSAFRSYKYCLQEQMTRPPGVCIEMEKRKKIKNIPGGEEAWGGGVAGARGLRSAGGSWRGGGAAQGGAAAGRRCSAGPAAVDLREEVAARGEEVGRGEERQRPLQIKNLSKSPPPVPYIERAFCGIGGGVTRPCK